MPTLLAKFNDRDIEIVIPDRAPVVGVSCTEAVILVDGTEYCCEWVKNKTNGTVHYSLLIDNRPVMVSVRSKNERFRRSATHATDRRRSHPSPPACSAP